MPSDPKKVHSYLYSLKNVHHVNIGWKKISIHHVLQLASQKQYTMYQNKDFLQVSYIRKRLKTNFINRIFFNFILVEFDT
jgi:hypothetical protein